MAIKFQIYRKIALFLIKTLFIITVACFSGYCGKVIGMNSNKISILVLTFFLLSCFSTAEKFINEQ
jgi:hypothetical protein